MFDNHNNLRIIQSKNIHDYKIILESLIGDFGFIYYHTILTWCGIIGDNENDNKYWQIYLMQLNNETVGICGLYSLYENSYDELWLGWFGVIPEKRNKNIGQDTLDWMKENAKSLGCKKLMAYVDKNGKPLSFYYRNNFKRIGTVKDYLLEHTELSSDLFESENDHVIKLDI
jgi:GNAT superfamily N-acetyltransferase